MSMGEVKAQKTSMQSHIGSFPASSGLFNIYGQCTKLAFALNKFVYIIYIKEVYSYTLGKLKGIIMLHADGLLRFQL